MAVMKSEMTFKSRAVTVTFQHNAHNFKNFTRQTKANVRRRLRDAATAWADEAVMLARKFCPVYHGDLENAIQKTETYGFGGAGHTGRMAVQVGVLDSWRSEYDSARKTDPPWGLSSPHVVMLLHEGWNLFAGKKARARAAKKGPEVGSFFLTRATEKATEKYLKLIRSAKLFDFSNLQQAVFGSDNFSRSDFKTSNSPGWNESGPVPGSDADERPSGDSYGGNEVVPF